MPDKAVDERGGGGGGSAGVGASTEVRAADAHECPELPSPTAAAASATVFSLDPAATVVVAKLPVAEVCTAAQAPAGERATARGGSRAGESKAPLATMSRGPDVVRGALRTEPTTRVLLLLEEIEEDAETIGWAPSATATARGPVVFKTVEMPPVSAAATVDDEEMGGVAGGEDVEEEGGWSSGEGGSASLGVASGSSQTVVRISRASGNWWRPWAAGGREGGVDTASTNAAPSPPRWLTPVGDAGAIEEGGRGVSTASTNAVARPFLDLSLSVAASSPRF